MKNHWILLIMAALMMSACGGQPNKRPQDFSLVFEWDTGALPPQYHYAYVITIGPGTQGEFVYSHGYEPLNEPNAWRTEFSLTNDQMDDLFAFLVKENMLRSEWKTGKLLVGGSNTIILITAGGKEYQIPPIAHLEDADRQQVEKVMEEICSYVPAEIWAEMKAMQSEFEANYGE